MIQAINGNGAATSVKFKEKVKWLPVFHDVIYWIKSRNGDALRKKKIAGIRMERSIRVINGLHTYVDVKYDREETIGNLVKRGLLPLDYNGPIFYKGNIVDPSLTLQKFEEIADPNFWPQLSTRFRSTGDENFNSKIHTQVTNEEMEYFRRNNTYHFIGGVRLETEIDIIPEFKQLIKLRFPEFYSTKLSAVRESKTGGWSDKQLKDIESGALSILSYQHIYFALMLAKHHATVSASIIEIGGGFGGLPRMMRQLLPDFIGSYTIVDLPFVSRLQEFFLRKESVLVEGKSPAFNFIHVDKLDSFFPEKAFDIAIATHSMTELDPEWINLYLDKFILHSRTALISMQSLMIPNDHDVTWIEDKMGRAGFKVLEREISEIRSWEKLSYCVTFIFQKAI